MKLLGWLGMGAGVWLIDSAIKGRKPLSGLVQAATTTKKA